MDERRTTPSSAQPPAFAPAPTDDVVSPTTDAFDPKSLPLSTRQSVLWVMCALKIITSYDSGAYGAVLGVDDGIAAELQMSVSEEGILGSAPFVGNTIGCAIAGVILTRYDAKPSLVASMAMHLVGTLLFAFTPNFYVAVVARVIIGFTLSFVVVYSIVWTDVFAPSNRATTWMAAMNGGVPLGMLLGFIVGGSVIPGLELSWRFTFIAKIFILLPVIWRLWVQPCNTINEPKSAIHVKTQPTASGCSGAAILNRTVSLLRNEIFVCATLSLVVLYFVITAMQVFITSYLRAAPFYASMSTIVFGFGATSVTAPVAGVITGGIVVDRLGGYQNLRRAAIFGACCGTLAAWFGLLAVFMTTVPSFIATLWFMLFCGAANVPVSTGIMMASVPPSMRSTASSYAAVAFNMFGYFMGPLVCGYLADQTGSLHRAFHIILLTSGVGVIPLCLSVVFTGNYTPPADPIGGLEGDDASCAAEVPTATVSGSAERSASPRTSGQSDALNTSTFVVEGGFAVPVTPQTSRKGPSTSSFSDRGAGETAGLNASQSSVS